MTTLRGEVWLAQLDEQRPVIVLTRNPVANLLDQVLVVPTMTTVRGVSVEVRVGPDDAVPFPAVCNLDLVTRIDKSRLVERIGHARESTMQALSAALQRSIGY